MHWLIDETQVVGRAVAACYSATTSHYYFWDPAGFTADGSVENFKHRRQTEIKHGRVSMLDHAYPPRTARKMQQQRVSMLATLAGVFCDRWKSCGPNSYSLLCTDGIPCSIWAMEYDVVVVNHGVPPKFALPPHRGGGGCSGGFSHRLTAHVALLLT